MRADNQGEGGILALMALAHRDQDPRRSVNGSGRSLSSTYRALLGECLCCELVMLQKHCEINFIEENQPHLLYD
jgi:hypothetical protein